MKKLYISGIVSTLIFLSGCGGGSSSSTGSTSTQATKTNIIQVVRGPVLGAIVKDANGKLGKDLKDGKGSYSFSGTITYPVVARGGVIDIDRDGKVSVGDVQNDLNLSTNSGNVVTMVTSYAADPRTKTMLENVARDFNISLSDLESKTPLNSKEVEAISNVMYKFAQDNNITSNTTAEIEKEIKSAYATYSVEAHDSKKVEKELVDRLSTENKVKRLDSTEVESEKAKIETEYKSELNKYEKEYGDSEYAYNGSYSAHYQGESCLKCHGLGGIARDSGEEGEAGEAGENQFTSGGTIFTKLNGIASESAGAYSIRLVLENVGTQISYNQGRGTGNVNASFSTGTLNGYTAEVIDSKGNVVNQSVKNSHNVARLDCNKCHTAVGANGAPGRIVSFNYYGGASATTTSTTLTTSTTPTTSTISTANTSTTTPTVIKKSFASDVLPVLQNKCQACHGSFGKFTITNSATPYDGVKGFVDNTNAIASRLLQKASGAVSHGGGVVISATSTEYATLRDWISEGANNN